MRNRLDWVAATCAIEHDTAMLADGLLRLPSWLDGAEPDMHTLWSRHAAKETEHKGVAMDVYRAAGGGYARRIAVYLQASFFLALDIFMQTNDNLRREGQLWNARTWISGCPALGAAATGFSGTCCCLRGATWHRRFIHGETTTGI